MHIAMVSEHASPLAGPGGRRRRWAERARRGAGRGLAAAGHEVTVLHPARHARPARRGRPLAPGVGVVHVTGRPAAAGCRRTSWCVHVPELGRRAGARPGAPTAPDVVHAPLLDVRAGRPGRGCATCDVPVVQTFHALGSRQAPPPGRARTPARRSGSSARAGHRPRRADRVHRHLQDEVVELVRMGVPRGGGSRSCLRGGPRRVLPGRAGARPRGDRPRLLSRRPAGASARASTT